VAKVISVFNNKGGVGKSTICWNLGHALGEAGKKVLLIDSDPQCNLSIAVLGEETFVSELPTENLPYGKTIRAYLQRFLQNSDGAEVYLHQGEHTSANVHLLAGDFWLNVYADSLNVGADLLSGNGLARYTVLRKIVDAAESKAGIKFDYVLVDLPPSFGALVRAAFYSSDYFIVPCTSDSFSVYCVGLIGQMVPAFLLDWNVGKSRFSAANPNVDIFDGFGQPKFAGWVFNGFDTARKSRTAAEIAAGVAPKDKRMNLADQTLHDRMVEAINDDLVKALKENVKDYDAIAPVPTQNYLIGDTEDANVLIQNSLWLHVPLGALADHKQVIDLDRRSNWRENQLEQIDLLRSKFDQMAENVIATCV
jgi:chromosome partitioning protein